VTERMDRLDADPDVTEGQVLIALQERVDDMRVHGAGVLDPEEFWQLGDLERYRAARAWWPRDAPPQCALPTLRELCMTIAGGAGTTPLPFMSALTILWERCVRWLADEGRNLEDPNESKEERRRRLGREAVRRHRELSRAQATNPAADRAKSLHAAYIEACRARKAAYDAATPAVEAARAAWEAATSEVA
jgi:hypothetical protein